jgi:hypothetical protein
MRLKTFDGIVVAASVIIGVILVDTYLKLQGILFNSKDYLIFVCPPNLIFLAFIFIMSSTTGLTLLYILRKYSWSYQRRVLKLLKRSILVILPITLLVLSLGIFDYAGVKPDGVYFRGFPDLLSQKKYSWDEVKQVDVFMEKTLKQGVFFNYVVVFKNGNALDLWEDDISRTIQIDQVLSSTGIHFNVGTLEESDLAPAYHSEIQRIRWLFRQR